MKLTLQKKAIATLLGSALFFVSFLFAEALTISPVRIEVQGDPGQTLHGEYLLINDQNERKTFYASYENFEAQGETGTPNFVVTNEGLMTWINTPEKEITLAPGESKKLAYSIVIPKDATPGGHFAAIFWGTTNPKQTEGEQQVMIGAKIGVLILLSVNGDVAEGGGITKFGTKDGGRFFTTLPVDLDYSFGNTGGDRIKPKATVKIKNTLGITTSVLNGNPQDGNILPASTRKFSITWNGVDEMGRPMEKLPAPEGFLDTLKYQVQHFACGMYFANITATYGVDDAQHESASFMFFVLPWQLLLVVLFVVLVLWKGLKMYNTMIVKRAQKTTVSTTGKGDESVAHK